jgi:chemotaxis protein MotB
MARRKKRAEAAPHDNEERWLLTYADMITLLMVLFVVMYAISNTDVRKFTALAQSVSAAFNNDVFAGTQQVSISDGVSSEPQSAQFDQGSGIVATDYRAIEASVRDSVISQGRGDQVSVDRVPEGIAIRISDALLFPSGRASIDDAAMKVVEQIATSIKPLPNNIRVEGHTDDTPPSGPFYADNWQLSTARALAVLDALQLLGVSPDRLAAAGYGQFKPIVANTDDASRARNRRVDVLILYPNESTPQPSPTNP